MNAFRFVAEDAPFGVHTRVFKDDVEVEGVRACTVESAPTLAIKKWQIEITLFDSCKRNELYVTEHVSFEDRRK